MIAVFAVTNIVVLSKYMPKHFSSLDFTTNGSRSLPEISTGTNQNVDLRALGKASPQITLVWCWEKSRDADFTFVTNGYRAKECPFSYTVRGGHANAPSIPHSLQGWVPTKSSISQLTFLWYIMIGLTKTISGSCRDDVCREKRYRRWNVATYRYGMVQECRSVP